MQTIGWRCSTRTIGARRAAVGVLLLALGLAAVAGCKNTNFLSTKQEIEIGREGSREIEREYRIDRTSADADRVRRVGARVVAHANERPGVPYSFGVVATKDVNAVSLPGGPVYVYRGLLDMVGKDDDALACVIGHELGHVNARHAAKLISQQQAAGIGIALVLGGSGRTVQNAASLAQSLLSLHYTREDEYEADRRGLSYAYKAGYDPHGMVRFFQKLQTMEKGGGAPEVLRTHPVTTSRITRAQKAIETRDYRYGQ